MVTLPKNCWPSVLGSVVIQLYAVNVGQMCRLGLNYEVIKKQNSAVIVLFFKNNSTVFIFLCVLNELAGI